METFSLRLWRAAWKVFVVELFWFAFLAFGLLCIYGYLSGFSDQGPLPFTFTVLAMFVIVGALICGLGTHIYYLFREIEDRVWYWIPVSSAYAITYVERGKSDHWLFIVAAIVIAKIFFLMGGRQAFRRPT